MGQRPPTLPSSPAVINGVVYTVSENDNTCVRVECSDRQSIVELPRPGKGAFSSPAVANNVVYIGSFRL